MYGLRIEIIKMLQSKCGPESKTILAGKVLVLLCTGLKKLNSAQGFKHKAQNFNQQRQIGRLCKNH